MVQQQYDNNNYTHCIYNKHATYYCCLANNAGRTLSNRTICSLFVNYYECDKSHVSYNTKNNYGLRSILNDDNDEDRFLCVIYHAIYHENWKRNRLGSIN